MKPVDSSLIKKEIDEECSRLRIPLVGFAPVERWEHPPEELPHDFSTWIPPEFWPQSIYTETRTVVVIGQSVPLPILETAPSIYYHELYNTVNTILDIKAYELSTFLTMKGHPSVFIPRDGYGDIEVLLEKPLTFFSHKHAAYLAGLGSFGFNNVLLTPDWGPRIRFTSIFTTLELEGNTIPGDDLCTHCLSCARNCPVDALEMEEKADFPPPMDKVSCATRSRRLRKEYRSPCGICIKVCPVGQDREIFKRGKTSMYTTRTGFEKYHQAWEHVRRYGSKKHIHYK